MKYKNRETGVILEPGTPEGETQLQRDPRYIPWEEKPRGKKKEG